MIDQDLSTYSLEALFDLFNEDLSEMDYLEIQEEIEYRLRYEDEDY